MKHSVLISRAILFNTEYIYSCFKKGCLTKGEKLLRQCRKLLWVMVVFMVAWVNHMVFHHDGRKQHKQMYSFFLVPCCWIALTSIKHSQTLTTHNANRHCWVHLYTFAGQPLSKQLYAVYVVGYHTLTCKYAFDQEHQCQLYPR